MPKLNYIRGLIESLSENKLKEVAETYAKKDAAFEAFLIEQSGKIVDSGKTFLDYQAELTTILKKGTSRKGFVKFKRLQKAGLSNYQKLLQSHFNNGNFDTALWMCLALLQTMHQAALMNTRYQWTHKPYKTFAKILSETRDQFDTAYRFAKIQRKERHYIFEVFSQCWWSERQKDYPQLYFDSEDLFKYCKRDEDLISIQKSLNSFKSATTTTSSLKRSSWKNMVSGVFTGGQDAEHSDLQELELRIKKELNSWT